MICNAGDSLRETPFAPNRPQVILIICSKMPSGVATGDAARDIILHMHDNLGLEVKTMAYLTGIPSRTVYRVLSSFKASGRIKQKATEKRGRPRSLDFGDTQVCPPVDAIAESIADRFEACFEDNRTD